MASSLKNIRVVKLGGSLLELADLTQRINDWIDRQPPASTIWIVGGGRAVDEIRERAKGRDTNEPEIHWACLQQMNLNSQFVSTLFPEWAHIETLERESDEMDAGSNWILSPLKWTREFASHLPMSWDVTSDSIAATLADWLSAEELVLLKSATIPSEWTIDLAIENGFVDRHFQLAVSAAIEAMQVRVVNLRDPSFLETAWDCKSLGY